MTAKILLVEDSRYLRTASRRLLTQAGFSVVEASDGEEALRQVRESQPDLIILDMLLPRLGGEHVLQVLRQAPATAHLPLIVLSGLSQKNAGKLKKTGATAYIEKLGVLFHSPRVSPQGGYVVRTSLLTHENSSN